MFSHHELRITDFRAVFFPYCLARQPEGTWLVLNRDYKPVGTVSRDWVDYRSHPSCVKLEGLTRALASGLHYQPFEGDIPQHIFLYEDSMSPLRDGPTMSAYLDKLELLARLDIVLGD